MKTNRFWVFVAFIVGVIAFVCLVGLCSMAMASDIPTAQRVKVMDGDSAASNILGTAAHPMRTDPTGTTNQPVTQATNPWVTSRNWTLSNGTDSIAAVESGTWSVRNQDGVGNALTSQASGSFRPLDTEILVAGVTVDPRGRTWTLSNGTDSIAAVESGTWSVRMQDGAGNALTSTAVSAARALDIHQVDTSFIVSGLTAVGTTPTLNPISISGVDGGGLKRHILTGTDGRVKTQLSDGTNDVANGYGSATNAVRVASQVGNATGAADFNSGVVTAQTPRVVLASDQFPMINRTDVSTTTGTTGNSSTFDSDGLMSADYVFNLSAISGTGATIQFHVQTSDDGTNWDTQLDTPKVSAATTLKYRAFRQESRYYRFTWTIAGTTPSTTFTVTSTLKAQRAGPQQVQIKYADIDLSVNGNASSIFAVDDCQNMNVVFIRGAGGANAVVQIFGSTDATNWVQVFGNVAVNASTSNSTFLQAQAWRYYEAQVTTHAAAGITADVEWSCN